MNVKIEDFCYTYIHIFRKSSLIFEFQKKVAANRVVCGPLVIVNQPVFRFL